MTRVEHEPESGEEDAGRELRATRARERLDAAVGPELAQRLLFALCGSSSLRFGWAAPSRTNGLDS